MASKRIKNFEGFVAQLDALVGRKCTVIWNPSCREQTQTSGTIARINITHKPGTIEIKRRHVRNRHGVLVARTDVVKIAPVKWPAEQGLWRIDFFEHSRLLINTWLDEFHVDINTPRTRARKKAAFKEKQEARTLAAVRKSEEWRRDYEFGRYVAATGSGCLDRPDPEFGCYDY